MADSREYIFMECDTCRAKPGSPLLCHGCLHNRYIITALTERLDTYREKLYELLDGLWEGKR